ncbi:MAG: thiamine pyrophosphate-dependent enzyme [Gammaproteobacteria bacterium]
MGVVGINPDFIALAQSCRCHALKVDSAEALASAVRDAFAADRPTLIEISESDSWLDA